MNKFIWDYLAPVVCFGIVVRAGTGVVTEGLSLGFLLDLSALVVVFSTKEPDRK